MAPKKPRRGRPPITGPKNRDIPVVRFRLSSMAEWEELEKEATRLGLESGHLAAKRRVFPGSV